MSIDRKYKLHKIALELKPPLSVSQSVLFEGVAGDDKTLDFACSLKKAKTDYQYFKIKKSQSE